MNKKLFISNVFYCGLLLLGGAHVNAAAISSASSIFYEDSLLIENGNGSQIQTIDWAAQAFADVTLFNDSGFSTFTAGNGFDSFISETDTNVSGTAGYDDFELTYSASTVSDSLFTDVNDASADAASTAYIAFLADSTEQATVSFDYDLFASTETDSTGEFSFGTSAISFSLYELINDVFTEFEFALDDDIFTLAQDGSTDTNESISFFDYTFSNLVTGDQYFVGVDTFAFSGTEAVASVPAPAPLLLLALGFLLLRKKSINEEKPTFAF